MSKFNWTIEWFTVDGVSTISRRRAATAEGALSDLRTIWLIGRVVCVYRGKTRPKQLAA